jgi:hypothetical protein
MRNMISMVAGVKRVTILPPSALPYIYPAPLHRTVAGVVRSLVKLLNVDFDLYPKFERCLEMAQVVTLRPGDTLYIPPLWWHHVESYGFNVMVNAWYDDIPKSNRQQLADATALFRANLSRFSSLDDVDLNALHTEFRKMDKWQKSTEHQTEEDDSHRDSNERLSEILRSIADLPPFWQDNFRYLYDYYVFRRYGDPYPTIPGMLQEVATTFRPGLSGKVLRKIFALRKRLFRS